MQVQTLSQEDPLEKEMTTHSSTLAWEIPQAEESGGLQSMGLQRVAWNRVQHIWNNDESNTVLNVIIYGKRQV